MTPICLTGGLYASRKGFEAMYWTIGTREPCDGLEYERTLIYEELWMGRPMPDEDWEDQEARAEEEQRNLEDWYNYMQQLWEAGE